MAFLEPMNSPSSNRWITEAAQCFQEPLKLCVFNKQPVFSSSWKHCVCSAVHQLKKGEYHPPFLVIGSLFMSSNLLTYKIELKTDLGTDPGTSGTSIIQKDATASSIHHLHWPWQQWFHHWQVPITQGTADNLQLGRLKESLKQSDQTFSAAAHYLKCHVHVVEKWVKTEEMIFADFF